MDSETKELYELKARIVQAVAHPIRLSILDYLKDGEQNVNDIAEHVEAQRSNVSRHLSVMLKAGVLKCRKEGLWVLYSLRTPCIVNFLDCVTNALREQVASNNAVLERL